MPLQFDMLSRLMAWPLIQGISLSRYPLRRLYRKGSLHPLGYLVTAGGLGREMKDMRYNECKYFVGNARLINLVLGVNRCISNF